ncbi:exodeoxyribonuclease VII small subunit [Spiroplasma endosymbiont of Aspidapion aeneum]|uniref:exodeoxyribonuclease VII small subunit n=1 Tax=Spiroplasma endosymbiont of Aspidapion aeneum TaxID=3066276 RepID=UPI00313BA720
MPITKRMINDIMLELKEKSDKINDPNTSLEDAIELYKQSKALFDEFGEKIKTAEGEVMTVSENGELSKLS